MKKKASSVDLSAFTDEDHDAVEEMVWSGWSRKAAIREVWDRIQYEAKLFEQRKKLS